MWKHLILKEFVGMMILSKKVYLLNNGHCLLYFVHTQDVSWVKDNKHLNQGVGHFLSKAIAS